ncbi:MAG: SOS response-associated peptidase family protein [Christensenellales bacterium]|jgi:putative SOS response-associated peptidase YedK
MCGSYCAPARGEGLFETVWEMSESGATGAQQVSFEFDGMEEVPREGFIVRPTDFAPVLTAHGYERMRFGFRVGYSSSPLFNARSESVHIKKTFAAHYAERRCLVPAAYYIEKGRRFYMAGGEMMFLAGIYREVAQGQREYVILTRDSSDAQEVRRIHHRMPVIMPTHMHRSWLEEGLGIDDAVSEVVIR